MNSVRRFSIKNKLMLIMMTTSSAAIILMGAALLLQEAISGQRSIQQQLTILADVIGSGSIDAITANDSAAAQERLDALAVERDIVYAAIERDDGSIVAEIGEPPGSALEPKGVRMLGGDEGLLSYVLIPDEIGIARSIRLAQERIGTIRIVSSLERFKTGLVQFLTLVIVIAMLSGLAACLLCSRLNKLVSDPILRLRQAMQTVSEKRDYSVRVDTNAKDESGVLAAGFNHMLDRIQSYDTELAIRSSRLEKEVAARTLELTASNRKRIVWLETMARFLRHELKNSTVGVKTSLDLIERRASRNQPIDVYLGRARKSMANMNTLLTSAGDASTLEATLYQEPRHRLDLSALIRYEIDQYRSIYPETTVIADCQDEIFVLGNDSRLVQMLDKLVSNAVEHADDRTPVTVSLKKPGNEAQLMVSNEGVALPKDKERLFDLFVSLRSPERKTGDNCGLGLYIVRLVAESHAGYLESRDIGGGRVGAVFTVTLPAV